MEPAVNASKQEQLQELLSRVKDLARATSDENAQLVNKVKELEVEVTVWKQAHSTASREGNPMGQKCLALCMIDGTRTIFSTSYITEGEAGGRKAGQEIIRGIVDYLADACSLQDSTVKLSISIYITKDRLRNDLASICPREQFDKFFVGLNETPYLNIVEVYSKRDADKKIEGHLQLFAGLPQTVHVFFSGGNGSEYLSIMPTLEACNAKDKLVILRSYTSLSNSTFARIPSLMLAGLFMKNTPPPATPFFDPSPFPVAEGDEMGSRTPSPKTNGLPRRPHIIDPSLPLYKQNPPPCNEYYLMQTCSKEGRCRYSHEYNLTDEQLVALANNAKRSPCWFLNNDRGCPHGTGCCWGHVCPYDVKCHYFPRDTCRFKGEGMHSPRGDDNGETSMERGFVDQARHSVPNISRETSSQLSDLAECPVCSQDLAELGPPAKQKTHLRNCLDGGKGHSPQTTNYFTYRLPGESSLIGGCTLCFKEFVEGSMISRLSCRCSFHEACLSPWLQRGDSCPNHMRDQ